MPALKTYLINLDRSGDRLAHMRTELARIGVAFERIPAIDGSTLPQAELETFRQARTAQKPGGWLEGEVGCFLSHIEAWRRIAAGSEAWATVLEDDVLLAADAGALLRSTDWIPAEAEIVRLEANRIMRLRGGHRIAAAPGRTVFRALSGSSGSAGYVIARHVAERLADSAAELHTSVDIFLFKPRMSPVARQLRRYQVVPAICVQDGVLEHGEAQLKSLIKSRITRGRGYRERSNPLLRLWPISRHAVPFRP